MTVNEIFHYIVVHIKLVCCSQTHNTVKNKAVCISRNIAGKLHVFLAIIFYLPLQFQYLSGILLLECMTSQNLQVRE